MKNLFEWLEVEISYSVNDQEEVHTSFNLLPLLLFAASAIIYLTMK